MMDYSLIWISWCDDLVLFGANKEIVLREVERIKRIFEVDVSGALTDFLGCKLTIDLKERSCLITQPVLIQSFKDEYKPSDTAVPLPANPGTVLRKAGEHDGIDKQLQKEYRGRVGRILHMAAWSRPDIANTTREVSRHEQKSTVRHHRAYMSHTANREWKLKPSRAWNGLRNGILFRLGGKSDSNYATCKDTRRSLSGYAMYLEEAPIVVKSIMQKIIALSVTEAELIALFQCIQEMMFAKKVIESMGFGIEKSMRVRCDNKWAVDLIN